MTVIHPSSLVNPKAVLAEDVVVGPFCIVDGKVKIGAGTVLMSHITVRGRTVIGSGNRIFQGAAVGCEPQDKKYAGEDTELVIGDNNVIRENCTLSIGTVQDRGITRIGSGNLLMANVHIAHDCTVGDNTIIANNCAIAGHCTIEDNVVIGGQTGMHQFTRVGRNAMVAGASGVLRDVPPYVICSGYPAAPHGLNLVGLRRAGFTNDLLRLLKDCYHAVYREGNLVADAVTEINALIDRAGENDKPYLVHFRDFVAESPRGIIR